MRAPLPILRRAATVIAITASLAGAQGEVTTSTAGQGYQTATRRCPTGMLMTGVEFRTPYPYTIECSAYGSDGHRVGPIAWLGVASRPNGPLNATLAVAWEAAHPIREVGCPGDQAVTSFRTHVDDTDVDYIEVVCAGIGANGGRTVSVKAGGFPASSTISATTLLACPASKFSDGVTTGAGGMALICIDAPLPANAVSSLALSAFQTVGGTAVRGTVTLNGLAAAATTVGLAVIGAAGVVVPGFVDVRAGARDATFQIQSAASAAGCATIQATIGRSSVSAPLIVTPQPPTGASFSFILEPEPASRLFAAPSTITAVIVLPSLKGALALTTKTPSVTFDSDRQDLLAIQSASQRTAGDTVKVTMSALRSGCAVVTATVNGVAWRKTLRLAAGF
jgi:hypothetical protein